MSESVNGEVEIPTKSKSLRAKSIQKRMETERNKTSPRSRARTKGCRENGYAMSKYRRRAANAKERDRMKLVNEAFERLRDVVPEEPEAPSSPVPCSPLKRDLLSGSKSTKVTTLRCAISYIKSLQQLIEDINNGSLDPELYNAFHSSFETDSKPTKHGRGETSGKGKGKSIRKKTFQTSKKKINNNNNGSSNKRKRKSADSLRDIASAKEKNSLSTVFASLHNIQQIKNKRSGGESCHMAKLKQLYTTLASDLNQAKRRATTKSHTATAPTSYIVVMTGNAGTVYQPVANATLPFQSFATLQQPKPLTLPGTSVPLPLQPLSQFAHNAAGLSDLGSQGQLLPSLDLLCPNVEDCESTLDDIEQVLKDAENFDILA